MRPASVLLARGGRHGRRDRRDQLPAHGDRRRGGRGRDAAARRDRPRLPGPRHLREAPGGERGARRASSGVRLLLTCRTRPRRPCFLERLGWSPLPSLRVWARLQAAPGPAARARASSASSRDRAVACGRRRPRAPRRRLAELALRRRRLARTRCSTGDGYAAVGRRGRVGVIAARRGRPARRRRRGRADGRVARRGAAAVGDAALRAARATCRRRGRSRCSASRSPGHPLPGAAALRARRPRLPLMTPARLRHAAGRPGAPGARRRRCAKIRALAARVRRGGRARRRAPSTACCRTNCRVRLFGARLALARGRALHAALTATSCRRGRSPCSRTWFRCFAILAAPLARPRRVPLLLWFTHWKPSRTLVLAERALDRGAHRRPPLVPARARARSSRSGTGSTWPTFRCVEREPAERLRVVALGRTSPAKGFETIVRAAALADVELELRGPSFTAEERAERRGSRRSARGSSSRYRTREVPALLARKDVLVNNMREGALDKVVYEAAATCMPVLASNTGFADVLPPELRFRRDDADGSRREAARARGRRPQRARPRAARAGRGAPLGRALGRRGAGGGARDDRPPRRRRSPASPAPRRTCSRCCPTCAARLGHPLPDAARERARRLGVRARARGRRRARRRDPDARRRRPGHVRARAHVPRSRTGRRSCTRTSSTPTPTARRPGTLAQVPVRLSTKHGFNEFREGRLFALGDRTIGALAHRQIAISRGLARYLAETEGFPEPDFEIVHYGIAAGPEPEPYAGERAALPLRRPPDPDQGPRRAAARVPARARRAARRAARHRRPRRARARAEGSRARARARRRRALPRPRDAGPARDRGVARGRRAVARRGLRHGRARGDGARRGR